MIVDLVWKLCLCELVGFLIGCEKVLEVLMRRRRRGNGIQAFLFTVGAEEGGPSPAIRH